MTFSASGGSRRSALRQQFVQISRGALAKVVTVDLQKFARRPASSVASATFVLGTSFIVLRVGPSGSTRESLAVWWNV